MNWFLIALIGPVLYACANHTDKYLLTKYLKNGEVGSLIIFASIFSIVALPVVILIHPDVFAVNLMQAAVLGFNGMLTVVAILLYFYALHEDEASYVVPFYQTIPVFAFVLAYFFLGETITLSQGGAAALVLLGALALSFNVDEGAPRFKKKVVFYMLGASILYAVNGLIFKLVAVNEGFWPSTFWGLIGKIAIGVAFLLFIPTYRKQFLTMVKANKAAVLGLNSLSESLFIVAEGVTQYATLLAPLALVLLVNSFQPLFVMLIGVLLTLLFPRIGRESLTKRSLLQKAVGIGLLGAGAYFLGG